MNLDDLTAALAGAFLALPLVLVATFIVLPLKLPLGDETFGEVSWVDFLEADLLLTFLAILRFIFLFFVKKILIIYCKGKALYNLKHNLLMSSEYLTYFNHVKLMVMN